MPLVPTATGPDTRDRLLAHEETARTRSRLRTASYAQIGERLYTRARGRWERYAAELEPVMPLLAPWIAPYDPVAIDVKAKFQPPSAAHWAGTDQLGRDLLSRIIWGARLALGISITSVGIAGAIGLILGLVAGYGPRWLDAVLVLIFDSMSSLPMIFFALAVITVMGPGTTTLALWEWLRASGRSASESSTATRPWCRRARASERGAS